MLTKDWAISERLPIAHALRPGGRRWGLECLSGLLPRLNNISLAERATRKSSLRFVTFCYCCCLLRPRSSSLVLHFLPPFLLGARRKLPPRPSDPRRPVTFCCLVPVRAFAAAEPTTSPRSTIASANFPRSQHSFTHTTPPRSRVNTARIHVSEQSIASAACHASLKGALPLT